MAEWVPKGARPLEVEDRVPYAPKGARSFDVEDYSPENLAKEAPGLAARAAKYAGESTADAVTGGSSIFSILDPAVALAGAAGSYLVPYTEGHFFDAGGGGSGYGSSFSDRWRSEMQSLRGRRGDAFKRSPNAALAGAVAPMVLAPEMLGSLPSFSRAASALPLATRMGAGAADAGIFSGASAAASNLDNHPLEAASQAATNPATLMLGAAGPAAPRLAQGLDKGARVLKRTIGNAILPRVKPTDAAATLRAAGVPLTTGQMAPDSVLGHIEETATSLPGVGPSLATQRGKGIEEWRNIALNKGAPPGMEPIASGSTQDRLAALYEGFQPAYAKIKGEKILAQTPEGKPLTDAFRDAVADPSLAIDDNTRAIASRYLENQLSVPKKDLFTSGRGDPAEIEAMAAKLQAELPGNEVTKGGKGQKAPPAPPPEIPELDASDLLKIRSNIRGAIRSAKSQQKHDLADLLSNAADHVTETIAHQLSPESAQHLADTDRQYAQYMTLENAAGRAGPESEFTPRQLAQAVKASAGKRATVQGRGGGLQDWAQAGSSVFDVRTPMTGARVVGLIPGGKFVHGGLAYGMNRPGIQSALLREPRLDLPSLAASPQTEAQVRSLLMAQALRGGAGRLPLRLRLPGVAADANDEEADQ